MVLWLSCFSKSKVKHGCTQLLIADQGGSVGSNHMGLFDALLLLLINTSVASQA